MPPLGGREPAPGQIRLANPVPSIMVEPCDDPDKPREVKSEPSIREIPLVGVALAAMRRPEWLPPLPGQAKQLVGSPQQVLPGERPSTDHHVIYSFRHSFEDRMKEGDVDAELRKMLMGHTVDRPDYGEEGSLAWRRNSLARIALPFDPAIV